MLSLVLFVAFLSLPFAMMEVLVLHRWKGGWQVAAAVLGLLFIIGIVAIVIQQSNLLPLNVCFLTFYYFVGLGIILIVRAIVRKQAKKDLCAITDEATRERVANELRRRMIDPAEKEETKIQNKDILDVLVEWHDVKAIADIKIAMANGTISCEEGQRAIVKLQKPKNPPA